MNQEKGIQREETKFYGENFDELDDAVSAAVRKLREASGDGHTTIEDCLCSTLFNFPDIGTFEDYWEPAESNGVGAGCFNDTGWVGFKGHFAGTLEVGRKDFDVWKKEVEAWLQEAGDNSCSTTYCLLLESFPSPLGEGCPSTPDIFEVSEDLEGSQCWKRRGSDGGATSLIQDLLIHIQTWLDAASDACDAEQEGGGEVQSEEADELLLQWGRVKRWKQSGGRKK